MHRADNQRTTNFTNAELNMFRRVHEGKSILEFLRERAPHYGPLAQDDLHKFRDEIVKASVGASISAAAGLTGPPPFKLMSAVLVRDYASLLLVADRQE
jgi:hypothetical protein